MQLLAHRDQVDVLEPDRKTSIAVVIAVIQRILRRPDTVARHGDSFRNQLSRALTDGYQRKGVKKSRNYPRRKEEPRTGPPKIERATAEQKRLDKHIASLSNAA